MHVAARSRSQDNNDEMNLSPRYRSSLLILISFLIVASAQPDWSLLACLLASSVGYALFWKGMLAIGSKKRRFLCATLWFMAVQTVQLSWFTADRYVGIYIYPFLFLLFIALGLQFGLITLFVIHPKEMEIVKMLGISGAWVLLEWGRLFVLSGFSWNPIGLSLSAALYSRQLVSILGVFGLSFWVIFTNLSALKVLASISWSSIGVWLAVATTPYLFGYAHILFHNHQMQTDSTPPLATLLVQTSIYPEEKMGSDALSPIIQWERILSFLLPYSEKPVDLIVLPEAAVPYGPDIPVYPIESVKHAFISFFGDVDKLPETNRNKVGNSYWIQALANTFSADVVIGLEDYERKAQVYNAAFLFRPFSENRERYEKRVLVPMGEYIPFAWCKKILSKYGIEDSFAKGKEAKVFNTSRLDIGMSICYEETYGHLMRENKQRGADLLINLSNDVWYPYSRLPIVHFLHGRLRAVEGGIPLIRACNTGVTCGVDSLGRLVERLIYEKAGVDSAADALYLSLPLYHYPTFYTYFGDGPIVIFSSCSFCLMGLLYLLTLRKKYRNRLAAEGDLLRIDRHPTNE